MAEFIDVVSTSSRYKETLVNGYSDYEIECIEKLYDIDVSGQLLSFLKQIGRCAGSAIGGNELVFYSERSVRQQVLLQRAFRETASGCRLGKYNKKLFLIGTDRYRVFVILRTTAEQPDNVYLFHENTCELEQTGQTLLEYVADCVKAEYRTWSVHQSSPVSYSGELISFE